MAVFQIAGNPTSGDIVLLDNADALISGSSNGNYLNINYPTATSGSTADVYGVVDTTPILFSVLSTPNVTLEGVDIFPNPTSGRISINGINTIKNVEVINITGQQVYYAKNSADNIDISSLQTGVYFMKITTENGFTIKKIVKK